MWEMAKVCGKWLKYLKNGLINCEMIQRFEKWLKFLELGQIYGARLKYLRYGTNNLCAKYFIMASMCCKRLKYLSDIFTWLEMTDDCDKRLVCVGNDIYMWEMA